MEDIKKYYLSDIIMTAEKEKLLHILEPIIHRQERLYSKIKHDEYFMFVEAVNTEYNKYKIECVTNGEL